MTVSWSDPGFTGAAYLWPGQVNASRAFRRVNAATGQPEPWPSAPVMEIPADTPILVTAALDGGQTYATFTLTVEHTAAALAAGRMYWLDSGRRIGTITVGGQP